MNAPYDALGSAMVRALTGDASLQWSAQTLYRGTNVVPLEAAHQGHVSLSLEDQRALLDGAGLRLALSDAALHAANMPTAPVERLVFELLEQLRVESIAPASLPGLRDNLSQRFLRWSRDFVDSGLTETSLGMLLLTIALSVWSRLGSQEIPERMSDMIEATRANISSATGGAFVGMRRHQHDQREFIPHALALSRWVGRAVSFAQAEAGNRASSLRSRNGFGLRLHFESVEIAPPPVAASGASKSWEATSQRYRVFTRAYDRQADATELVRAEQLIEFRAQMDQELGQLSLNVPRLARALHRMLALPRRDGWRFSQEQGYIDGSRLSQLISDPQERAIFKTEQSKPHVQCAVGILLDCSGSMKGHAAKLSLLVDVLGRALESAGVTTEILGFSTQSWNGGRARTDWQRAGKPQFPGRLNETLHIVLKAGTAAWRRGRRGIAALRRADLFREGADGEAVEWACQRLLSLPADRRILMVISDGCPMDSATHQSNDEHYLEQHLKQVISSHERGQDVEICALGVGLDLGCFYRHRMAIDLRDDLNDTTLLDIATLLASRRHRHVPHA